MYISLKCGFYWFTYFSYTTYLHYTLLIIFQVIKLKLPFHYVFWKHADYRIYMTHVSLVGEQILQKEDPISCTHGGPQLQSGWEC